MLLAAFPAAAAACSCVPLGSPCQGLWDFDGTPHDVFEGTVLSVTEVPAAGAAAGLDGARTVARLAGVRGRLGRTTTEVFTSTHSSCGVHFEVGRRYLFDTRITDDGAMVHACSYTRPIESAGPLLAFMEGLDHDGPGAMVTGQVTLTTEGNLLRDVDRPLAGIEVRLHGQVTRTAITDADGHFSFTGVAPGDYAAEAREDAGRALAPRGGERFTLAHTRACRTVSLAMGLTSLVEGVLRDRAGVPVPGMTVELRAAGRPTGPPSRWRRDAAGRGDPLGPVASSRDLTSPTGRFVFRGVPPGRYVVGVNVDAEPDDGPLAPVYLADEAGRPLVVELGLGEHRDVRTLSLPHARVPLTGTVVTPDGRPAAGEVVSAQAQGGRSWSPEAIYAETDGDGRFRLLLAPGPRYRLVIGGTPYPRGLDVGAGAGPVTLVVQPRR